MTQDEAKREIIQKWQQRPAHKQTDKDVMFFYVELKSAGSKLLTFPCAGDRYPWVAGWLDPYVQE